MRRFCKETGTNGRRHPLTYILEAADDIAYKTADIEDAFIKGFLSYHQLKEELAAFGKRGKCRFFSCIGKIRSKI